MHANTMFRSNPREYVVHGLDVLLEGLTPFIEGRFRDVYGPCWYAEFERAVGESREWTPRSGATPDAQALLKIMLQRWDILCRPRLDWRKRDLAHYLLRARNECMHQQPFSVNDAYRALEGIEAMLAVIVAPQWGAVRNLKELLLQNTCTAPAPLSPTNTSASIKGRHPRLR